MTSPVDGGSRRLLPPPEARPPAGWYPDPWNQAPWRWWDGSSWSSAVSAGAGSGATRDGRRKPRLPAWLSWPVLVAAVVMVPIAVIAAVLSPITVVLSLVPLLFVLPVVAWLDRVEPEPRQARLHALLWGATVAILVAGTVNSIVAVTTSEGLATVVSAPLIEEFMKGLGIYMALRRREIDSVLDGLVYAGWVAVGFAVMEDVQYFLVAADGGVLAQTFIIRGLLTPFAHPLFTAWTGIAIGATIARNERLFPRVLLGYAMAVALHASWNGSLTLATSDAGGFIVLGAILVFVGLFVGCVLVLGRMRRREQARFVAAVPQVAQRHGITRDQAIVFCDWGTLLRTRRSLSRPERKRFDRQHAALARLVALSQRTGDTPPADEQRLLAAWHDTLQPSTNT